MRLKVPKGMSLDEANHLSQLNVLAQIEHLKSYPVVQERLKKGDLGLHALWFDLATASVYAYESAVGQFVLIDEEEGRRLISHLGHSDST